MPAEDRRAAAGSALAEAVKDVLERKAWTADAIRRFEKSSLD